MLVRESRLPVGSSARMSLGIHDHGARDSHALLLAAGELIGAVLHAVSETDARERRCRPAAALGGGNARVEHRQLDVFDARWRAEED